VAIGEGRPGHARSSIEFLTDAGASAAAQYLQRALASQVEAAAAARGPQTIGLLAEHRGDRAPDASLLPDDRVRAYRARLAKPDTAAALTLGSFLPWLEHGSALSLAGIVGFRELHFDARCPTGVRGTPPVIDFMATGSGGVAGACACVFDYLVRRPRKISPAYAALELSVGLRAWSVHLGAEGNRRHAFRHVDAVALAKLAIGLGKTFSGRPVRLLYLFLEPVVGAELPYFRRHRQELADLVESTAGGDVLLVPMSFHELWATWQGEATPPPVRGIAAELSRRYGVAIGGRAGL
jgi:hypothetical protein